MTPIRERFFKKVRVKGQEDCWIWTGAHNKYGYGRFNYYGKIINAHTASYLINKGEVSPELHVLHQCDNPPCVNPAHLFLGTNLDNIKDKCSKNRQKSGEKTRASKLTSHEVRSIRAEYRRGKHGQGEGVLARKFHISKTAIHDIVNNKSWKHLLKGASIVF